MSILKRIRTLWKVSGLDLGKESKTFVNPVFSVDGIKERLGITKMARIVEDDPLEIFKEEENDKTSQ